MSAPKKVSLIFGTRPEAIKLAPLILAMQRESNLRPHVCVTGQHRQMLDQVLEVFDIRPDVDLELMVPNQTLASITARCLLSVDEYLANAQPDLVLVQGDTTTVFAAATAAFYRKIPIGHVEAGLRTSNIYSPFPEEFNRVVTTRVAEMHFAPTPWARDNLLREGVPADRTFVTGNTVIDALRLAIDHLAKTPCSIPGLPPDLLDANPRHRLVLITGHRRENFGAGFANICLAIRELANRFPEVSFVYPVHLNPNVRKPVFESLDSLRNVYLIEPLDYLPFVALMNRSMLILTDSGGVQEEGPSLGKPVLVMRDTTERPEGIQAGTVRLVGTDTDTIVSAATELLTDSEKYNVMASAINPYGDGQACRRILEAIQCR